MLQLRWLKAYHNKYYQIYFKKLNATFSVLPVAVKFKKGDECLMLLSVHGG